MKITKEQILKMMRKLRRDIDLASGIRHKSGWHKSKKDKKRQNTVKPKEYDQ